MKSLIIAVCLILAAIAVRLFAPPITIPLGTGNHVALNAFLLSLLLLTALFLLILPRHFRIRHK